MTFSEQNPALVSGLVSRLLSPKRRLGFDEGAAEPRGGHSTFVQQREHPLTSLLSLMEQKERTMVETPREPPDHLNNKDGDLTGVKAGTASKGDPAELLRGVGQENISARPARPRPSDPTPALPKLDDDATQMKKIEDAAGTEPSPPGVAEPEGARELPRPPLADPN
ncbi:hypothetical protein RSD66_04365 [Brevundimonas sp. S1H14]|uniref:hypothetical protein n=1 Tax=Brevundimonas sp. S1H14 TaxID=3078084 RepID=UPI0039EA5138